MAALSGIELPAPKLTDDHDWRPLMDAARRVRAVEHFLAERYSDADADLATSVQVAQLRQLAGGGLLSPMVGLTLEEAALKLLEQMRGAVPHAAAFGSAVLPLSSRATWPSVIARGVAQDCVMLGQHFMDLGHVP